MLEEKKGGAVLIWSILKMYFDTPVQRLSILHPLEIKSNN